MATHLALAASARSVLASSSTARHSCTVPQLGKSKTTDPKAQFAAIGQSFLL
jgi:hypothetical protein